MMHNQELAFLLWFEETCFLDTAFKLKATVHPIATESVHNNSAFLMGFVFCASKTECLWQHGSLNTKE